MVKIVESTGKIEDLDATVESVVLEKSAIGHGQYKITLKPHNVNMKAPSGRFFEWIPLSKTATQEAVPKDSVVEKYLMQMEICVPQVKKAATLDEAFKLLVGKRFVFKRFKLGKGFDGNAAKEYLVPVRNV